MSRVSTTVAQLTTLLSFWFGTVVCLNSPPVMALVAQQSVAELRFAHSRLLLDLRFSQFEDSKE
jgi:hypothetical protein